jgi:hypothetical protein
MTNKTLFVICYFLFVICFTSPLWAQPQSGGGRYVVEQRYILQLVWLGDEYTAKYEVVFERNDGKNYIAFMREYTELPSLQVSLAPGKYRYRVIPYDFLDQPGEASDWINIEIKPAPIAAVEEQDTPESEKIINTYASAAWLPIIPLYGRMREIFGIGFNAVGASVRFGALYNDMQWFSPGVELSTSWYALNNDQGGDGISIQTGVTGFNLVAQKKLPNPSMAVTVRAGAAFAFHAGEINMENYSYTTGGVTPQINIEASFLWFAYKRLYLEAGVGFTHLLGKDDNSGFLRPWVGAGWQF